MRGHHHEVGGSGQCEIGTKFAPLTQRADWIQKLKYVVHNVAASYGKTATFMPKPVVDDNGSGMHVHQSVWKDGNNLFAGEEYAGLSEFALYYIEASSSMQSIECIYKSTRTHISAWSPDLRPLSSWHILQEIDLHQSEYLM